MGVEGTIIIMVINITCRYEWDYIWINRYSQ